MGVPMKTRAAVALEAGKPLEVMEVNLEGPKEGEVLIEIKATGICHTDEFTLSGADPESKEAAAWSEVKEVFNTFADADHYVFSVPMWNFNIPYKLKHYIDVVTQPGMSWSFSPVDGYKGLMTDKTATVIYASGDGYSEGTGFESFDIQKPYVNLWLTFLGFKKIDKVIIDRTLFDAETAEKNALDVALKLANINTL